MSTIRVSCADRQIDVYHESDVIHNSITTSSTSNQEWDKSVRFVNQNGCISNILEMESTIISVEELVASNAEKCKSTSLDETLPYHEEKSSSDNEELQVTPEVEKEFYEAVTNVVTSDHSDVDTKANNANDSLIKDTPSTEDTSEDVADMDKPLTKRDMLTIMSQFSEKLHQRDEDTKEVIIGLQNEVRQIKEDMASLKSVPQKLENHVFSTKQKFSDVNASILTIEDRLDKFDRQLHVYDPVTKATRFAPKQTLDKVVSRVFKLETATVDSPTTAPSANEIQFNDGETISTKIVKLNTKIEGLSVQLKTHAADVYNIQSIIQENKTNNHSPTKQTLTYKRHTRRKCPTQTHSVR